MDAARGIVTARGGMTSHAAVVARGMGRPCVSGAGELQIDAKAGRRFSARGRTFKAGEVITIDGAQGRDPLRRGQDGRAGADRRFRHPDGLGRPVPAPEACAPTPRPRWTPASRASSAPRASALCRTEHMFFDDEPHRRRARDDPRRRRGRAAAHALAKMLPMQRRDFVELFGIMEGLPVTVRLLDPPLHEFLPHTREDVEAVAEGDRSRRGQADAAGARSARDQPDARPPRLPAGRLLSRDLRDAGARDHRGGPSRSRARARRRRSPRSCIRWSPRSKRCVSSAH